MSLLTSPCFCIRSNGSDVSDADDEEDYYQINFDNEDDDVYGDLIALKNTSMNGGPRGRQLPHIPVITHFFLSVQCKFFIHGTWLLSFFCVIVSEFTRRP